MQLRLRPPTKFWLPKAGNSAEEYEDALSVVYPQQIGAAGRSAARASVADGASESAFAREWARALVDSFAAQPPELTGITGESLSEWLAPAQRKWYDSVPWDRIPWHGEAKARQGAFATLLGLTIAAAPHGSQGLSWQALAVGDCCLFIVRDDRLALSFPIEEASQFDNNPALICSNPDNAGDLWKAVRRHGGECEAGDVFILASDALAGWFLAANSAGDKPWETLAELDSSNWAGWIEEQRSAGLMRNDDTTLVALEVV